ncbi:MAG: hypothetical protein PGN11_04980 [Quadrisphaera sp.]
MSVSATGGPGRPLHPASSHSGGKRHGPGATDFPGVRGQGPAVSAVPAEEGHTGKAGRDGSAGRQVAAPASVTPHDAYAAYQLAKKLGDGAPQGAVGGPGAAHRSREASTRFEVGAAARDLSSGADDDGVDVRA